MNIGIIGASGKAGSLILKEVADRGHQVTAIVRNPAKIQVDRVRVLQRDALELRPEDIKDMDVVVNAFGVPRENSHLHSEVGQVLFQVFAQAACVRLVYVGGAGSLYKDAAKTMKVLEGADFTQAHLKTATAMSQNYDNLEKTSGFPWVYLCPAEQFDPGGRKTGQYRTNADIQIFNSKGNSYLSYADYAVAVLDEIETPKYHNKKVSIVGEE